MTVGFPWFGRKNSRPSGSNLSAPQSEAPVRAAGALDHAYASASLKAQVTGVAVWHINADEPTVLDYNTESKSNDLDLFDQVSKFCMSGNFEADFEAFAE